MARHLCIDIGNSYSDFAIYNESIAENRWKLATKDFHDLQVPYVVSKITVTSVVKSKNEFFSSVLFAKTGIEPHFVSLADFPNIDWSRHFQEPAEIGADILVGAYGAAALYPDQDLLIFDFGTATTMTGINSQKEFLGGIIIPGLALQAMSLSEHTDQLGMYTIHKPSMLFGQTTEAAINSGIFHSHVGAIKEYISLAGASFKSIATGGAVALFKSEVAFDEIVEDLVLATLSKL